MDEKDKNIELHKFDQEFECWLRMFPSSLWSFYSKLKSEGFNEREAFELTKSWLISIASSK